MYIQYPICEAQLLDSEFLSSGADKVVQAVVSLQLTSGYSVQYVYDGVGT